MRANIGCVVVLLGAMAVATSAVGGEAAGGVARNRGLSPIIVSPIIEVLATNNLLADGMVADASPSLGNFVAATATDVQGQYDVAYSICQTVAPVGGADYQDANWIIPNMASVNYFSNRGISLNSSDSFTVTLLDAPKHGVLELDKNSYGAYLYKPNAGYFGGDRMIFSVEVKGKVFKVIYSVDVVEAPGDGSPSCPTGNGIEELPKPATGRSKRGSLDILELPSATQIPKRWRKCTARLALDLHSSKGGRFISDDAPL